MGGDGSDGGSDGDGAFIFCSKGAWWLFVCLFVVYLLR